jgi:predicted MPP superfamily phosphohydrolase
MELNRRDLDLILLGGDFSMRGEYLPYLLTPLGKVSVTDGIFGVEGNHDDYRWLFSVMEQMGMTPIDNSGAHIRDGFFLAGVRDPWNRNADIAEAIAGANPDDFILLVSHNPDVSMSQTTDGIDLILSGHTHGGQITFFGIPLYLLRGTITNYGMRFGYGFAYSADGVPVFVSSGVGTYYDIPRIFVRPEVVIFTMHHGGAR